MIDAKTIREHIMRVAGVRDKNEKLSWSRRKKNLEDTVKTLEPIEQQIIELQTKKMRIMDDIQEQRNSLLRECVHPTDYLVHLNTHILCKFCNAKLSIPKT